MAQLWRIPQPPLVSWIIVDHRARYEGLSWIMDNDGLSWILMDYGLSLAMDYRGFWTIRVVSWILDYHGIMADSGLSWYIMDYCGLWTIMDYFGLSPIIVGYPNFLGASWMMDYCGLS